MSEDPKARLIEIAEWAEEHSQAILDALKLAISDLPVARISRFERALDSMPAELKE